MGLVFYINQISWVAAIKYAVNQGKTTMMMLLQVLESSVLEYFCFDEEFKTM